MSREEKGGSRMAAANWASSQCLQTPPAHDTSWVNVSARDRRGRKLKI